MGSFLFARDFYRFLYERRRIEMILLTILLLTLLILVGVTIFAISLGGAVFIIIFADVIVCALFIVWLVKRLIGRKKK